MDRQKLLKYLNDPATLNGSSLAELQELVRQFPYFSAAQILLAKNFHNLDSVHYNKQLKLASAYSFDRKLLYSIIMEKEKSAVINELIESTLEENKTLKDQIISVAKVQEETVSTTEESELTEEKAIESNISESIIDISETEIAITSDLLDEVVSNVEEPEKDTIALSQLSPREIIENRLREITGGRDEPRATDTSSEVRDKSKPGPDLTNILNPSTGILRSSDPIEESDTRERQETSYSEPLEQDSKEISPLAFDEIESEVVDADKSYEDQQEITPVVSDEFERDQTDTDSSTPDFIKADDRIEADQKEEIEVEVVVQPEEPILLTEIHSEVQDEIIEEDLIPELDQTILEELPVTIPLSVSAVKDETLDTEKITEHLSETHSFSDWLKLSKRSVDDENTELINIVSKSEDQVEEDFDSSNMKAPVLPANKEERTKIIDKFIQEKPRIEQGKTSFFSPMNMARKSVVEHEDIYSETLAKIYDKQGNYLRALKMYEKLRLKYPEKSTSFAAQITRLRSLIESQDN